MFSRTCAITAIAIATFAVFYQAYFSINNPKERRAWITLLGTEDYLPGVLALARSLKRASSIYPLVVMLNENDISDETKNLITNEGCSIRFIEKLYPTSTTGFAFPRFLHTWKKL